VADDWLRPDAQKEESVESRWAVLRSQPRREPLAAQAVKSRGVETYFPRLPHGGASRVETPLFPGYLFAHVAPDTDDLLRIRSAPGVAYVLPRIGEPALLPADLIAAIQTREHELRSGCVGDDFQRGDHVRVTSGPFRWVEGLFERRLSAAGRVRILLNLVHGTFALQLGAAQLERAGAAHP
jgi:transcriptional antiterminator RfaH